MDDRSNGQKADEALARCQETVENLKEENTQLRESAQTFGDLAERLNTQQRPGRNKRGGALRTEPEKSLPDEG
jgi:hypothetical protein